MKKAIVAWAVIAAAAGVAYLFTGAEKLFLTSFVCSMVAAVSWIGYEMDLADEEIDMQIEEWNIRQEQEREMLITKTAIRRELIKVWEGIE